MPFYTAVARVASSAALDPIDELPPDFNPTKMPILAEHFYGVAPFRAIGEIAAEVVGDVAVLAISYWFTRADEADGEGRIACLLTADTILRKTGLRWGDFVPRKAA